MSTKTTSQTGQPVRGNLRGRLALQAAVMAFALTMLFLLTGVLSAKIPARFDVTATREHQLSPQTKAILARLTAPVDLVIAADLASLDAAARRRTLDVISTFERGSVLLRPVVIDTSAQDGLRKYDEFLAGLARESAPAIEQQSEAVRAACAAAESAVVRLEAIGKALEGIRDSAAIATGTPRAKPEERERFSTFWNAQAAAARTLAEDTKNAAAKARRVLGEIAPPLPVPAVDEAARGIVPPLTTLATGLSVLARSVDQFIAEPASEGPARDRARALVTELASDRDGAARAVARVDGLPMLPILSVARAVQRTRAVLLINRAVESGAGSVTALDVDSIIPAPAGPPGSPARMMGDGRARAEELIATGLATVINPARPVVVLVHGAPAKAGPGFKGVRGLVDHMALKGIDVLEWPTAIEAEPPRIPVGPGGTARPAVFVSLCMDVRTPDDAARMSKLAAALSRLVGEGKNVLVSVNTSNLPGAGAPDPMTEFLTPLGLSADSGRPLLEESKPKDAPGREVGRDMLLTAPLSAHAISGAIDGLRTRLPWAVPLRVKESGGAKVKPVIEIAVNPRIWAEPEWNMRQGLPANDSARDDAGGPGAWVVAAAIEREVNGVDQRVVVVGSAAWLVDSTLAMEAGVVDGRKIADAPGNLELLSASVAFLAHRDESIARSPMARAVATIPNLSTGQRGALRVAFVGVLPLAVLLLGVLWRVWRG